MLFGSDRSFTLGSDFRPCSFCEDGPGEPSQIDCQVVKSAEIMGHAISVGMNDGEQICAHCLHEGFIADRVIRFATKATCASILRRWNSMHCHFIHYSLPGPRRHFRIVGDQVSASDIEI